MVWRVGFGDRIKFWEDRWIDGEATLLAKYPRLYLNSCQQNQVIQQMGVHKDTGWEWDFKWRRHLFDSEIAMAVSFLSDVEGRPIQAHRRDDWAWKPDPSGQYSAKSAYDVLRGDIIKGTDDVVFEELWKLKIPSKISATGARPYSGKVGPDDADKVDMAYRVVADHIRTLSFAIADGSRPGNDGREYVLRRILRRAVRYGREVLKAKEGFFNGLVSVVVNVMGDVFPELKQQETHIRNIIEEEEESFGRTLIKEAFVLWDTYGFPLDLTQLMAEEKGLVVDVKGFDSAMEAARERSRSAQTKQAGGAIVMDADATSALHKRGIVPTNDSFKYAWFKDHESVVKAIYTGSEFVDTVNTGDDIGVVLESTSFYAEQGGQIFDTGSLEGPHALFEVRNVQVYGGFVLHIGNGTGVSVGDKVVCKVDYGRRALIAPNHTCTHMLNFALREVLGDHVDQKGSIVLAEKLRFDFSHGKPIEADNLRRIESIVNEQIKAELDVSAKEATLAEAKGINGLRAVFGEVYPDPVRVVSIGQKVEDLLADPKNEKWLSISSELCGGTHISNTREAKAFALLSEEGIAKGIRRITAVTTDRAYDAMKVADEFEQQVDDAAKLVGTLLEEKVSSLKSNIETLSIPAAKKADIKIKIVRLQDQVRKAQKQVAEENKRKAVMITAEKAELAVSNGKTFCISLVDVGLDVAAVREAVTKVMDQKGLSVMVFSTDESTNKAVVCAGVPEKGGKGNLDVADWLSNALGPLKGRCGKGKGGLATGQGTEASHVNEAIDLAEKFASMKLTLNFDDFSISFRRNGLIHVNVGF
ncbi:Alanine--tRNA ligase [Glycine max]|nr:Alanine--tRNA ligase [Glycine max]